jgi:hypothetical protein
VTRFALKTSEGRALLRSLGLARSDLQGLIRLTSRAEAEALRRELEGTLSRIEAEVGEFRAMRERGGRPLAEGKLTSEEMFLVEILSRRYLKLENAAEVASRYGANGIAFLEENAATSWARGARVFREWRAPARAAELLPTERAALAGARAAGLEGAASGREILAESAPGVARRLTSRFRNFLDEMRLCQLKQPPVEARGNWIRYFATSLAVSEAITVGSYVVAMGEESFSLEELTTDMLIAAVYTTANVSFLRPNLRFRVQWIRTTSAIWAQDVVDSTIYFISPLHRIRTGESRHTMEEATRRFAFNSAFTALSSGWTEVMMYELINGILCMNPGSRMAKIGTSALRIAGSTLTTVIYFRARREVLGH